MQGLYHQQYHNESEAVLQMQNRVSRSSRGPSTKSSPKTYTTLLCYSYYAKAVYLRIGPRGKANNCLRVTEGFPGLMNLTWRVGGLSTWVVMIIDPGKWVPSIINPIVS